MSSNLKALALIFGFLLRGYLSHGQEAYPVLENYIKEGVSNNSALKTQQFDLEKSYTALEQAKTLFMPQVNFQMQYTLAAGGRALNFPIGDLLNPVYTTLNRLTQSNNFNTVENANINFLPNNFHETKIHTVYPILNKEILYNREVRKELISVEQIKINIYKRELVKNIKMAYIQYLQAQKAVDIYRNALGLVNENLRVNQKLVKNDVALNSVVLKAKLEVSKVENSIVETENNAKNAAAYFNFLLNKPFDSKIDIDEKLLKTNNNTVISVQKQANSAKNREELAQIQSGQKATSLLLKLNESYKTPKIGASLDLGFQGFGFKVWDKQAYFLLGLQMDLPLYTAGNSKLKIQQAQLDLKKLDAQKSEITQQIELQIQIAKTNLETAEKALIVNDAELASSREYYRILERRYREGQVLQIELTDARTQLTAAELKQSLAQFAILLRGIELERAEASYKF